MKHQAIPHTDLTTARLSYGCMRIVGTWNPQEVTADREAAGRAAVIAAYEAGYTLFDHADIYCANECERVFGQVLREIPSMRDEIVIATKCGIRFPGDPSGASIHLWDFSKEHILSSCDRSLAKLGVEMIDIYQLHRPDLLMDPSEVAEAFDILHRAGKVRYFGVSNFSPSFVTTLQKFLPARLVVNQVEIHAGRLDCFTDGTLDQCIAEGLTPLAWSPLGGGFLGNGAEPKNERQARIVAVVDEIAAKYGATRTTLALAWLLRHPAKIVPIVGSANPANIREATKADDIELGQEDWYRILVASRGEDIP